MGEVLQHVSLEVEWLGHRAQAAPTLRDDARLFKSHETNRHPYQQREFPLLRTPVANTGGIGLQDFAHFKH